MTQLPSAEQITRSPPGLYHRLALAPILVPSEQRDALARELLTQLPDSEHEIFAEFVARQGLGAMWAGHSVCKALPLKEQARDILQQSMHITTARYLSQRGPLQQVKAILEEAQIPHLVFKGCHLRERYYPNPALRPAYDIDVLVTPQNKISAIKAFQQAGLELYMLPENVSHEVSLHSRHMSVDLHWDVFRPGRARISLAELLLVNCEDHGSHWGPILEHNLFLALVHPVFTKYLTTPTASLMRVADVGILAQQPDIKWDKVYAMAHDTGLATAAWASLSYLHYLCPQAIAQEQLAPLQPGNLRRRYLHQWLQKNLASRLIAMPTLVQTAFTLPLHDRPGDSWRALTSILSARRSGRGTLNEIKQAL